MRSRDEIKRPKPWVGLTGLGLLIVGLMVVEFLYFSTVY